jgi:hypothetical protein
LQTLVITYEEFFRKARDAGSRSISLNYRPCQKEVAYTFSTSVGQLLSDKTYSVHSSNRERTSFTNYNDPNAIALRFDELVSAPLLLNKFLEEGVKFQNCQLTEANVVSLRCGGCNRRIIVDGVHRLVRLASEKQLEAIVYVVELSGCKWPLETPDFNLVCVCPREQILS